MAKDKAIDPDVLRNRIRVRICLLNKLKKEYLYGGRKRSFLYPDVETIEREVAALRVQYARTKPLKTGRPKMKQVKKAKRG